MRQARDAEQLCGRSFVAQLGEFAALRRKIGMTAREYFLYELYRGDHTSAEKQQYLTRALHDQYLSPLDPPEFREVFANKLAFKRQFGAAGLAVPLGFGIFHSAAGTTDDGAPLRNRSDLVRFLEHLPQDGLVVKPVVGGCGFDVLVFHKRGKVRTTLVHVDGREFCADRLYEFLVRNRSIDHGGFLFEERVEQHAVLSALNPATLNTLRVVTLIDRYGRTHVIGATLKIGLDDSGVDSLVEEQLCAAVDWNAGRVGPAWRHQGVAFESLDRHPVNDARIAGLELPYWSELQELVTRASQTIPQVRSVGWDVGFSARGPVLIEGNEIWGEEILQIPLRRGIWTAEFRRLI